MLALLVASQKKKIAKVLAAHGFTPDEYAKGWALFKNAVGVSFSTPATTSTGGQNNDLTALDAWENKWFPIISAVLQANFPAVYDRVFLNLSQTGGVWLIPSVEMLLERLAALSDEDASQEDKDARDLLTKRGVDQTVVDEAKQLIENLKTLDEQTKGDEADSEDDDSVQDAKKAAKKAAEEAMWSFYKEWSAIARVVIKSKKELKSLGFLKTDSKAESKDKSSKPTTE